jgi:hypothetical protein
MLTFAYLLNLAKSQKQNQWNQWNQENPVLDKILCWTKSATLSAAIAFCFLLSAQ